VKYILYIILFDLVLILIYLIKKREGMLRKRPGRSSSITTHTTSPLTRTGSIETTYTKSPLNRSDTVKTTFTSIEETPPRRPAPRRPAPRRPAPRRSAPTQAEIQYTQRQPQPPAVPSLPLITSRDSQTHKEHYT
jgi:hypothetical protein